MPTLHTVSNSPFEHNALKSCLDHATPGDTILLIEDSVVGARKAGSFGKEIGKALANCRVCALAPDLSARGIAADTVLDGIELVDYGGFVDLAAEHERTQAWL